MPTSTSALHDVPLGVWIVAAALLIMLGLMASAFFPRYAFQVVGDDGRAVLIQDRWTGQVQRANYDASGNPELKAVLKPF